MKYEENVWYGWNGGDCPVHPKTAVEAIFYDGMDLWFQYDFAGDFDWLPTSSVAPVAFRVIKEYREPREWWVNVYENGYTIYSSEELAKECALEGAEAIRVREIMDDDE